MSVFSDTGYHNSKFATALLLHLPLPLLLFLPYLSLCPCLMNQTVTHPRPARVYATPKTCIQAKEEFRILARTLMAGAIGIP